jgi:O-antigen/teichoic acid export membrane protein
VAVRPQSHPRAADDVPARRPAPSGTRSAAIIGVASLLATALNYLFLLAAGRILGSDDYGALAALLGILTVALLPAGALQLAVSREVAQRLALGDEDGADAFGWATVRLGAIVTAPLALAALALAVPLKELLRIDSTAAVVLAAIGLLPALLFPISVGLLQGEQRFHAVAAMYVLPFALRLVLLAAVTALGFGLGGAVYAAVFAGVVTTSAALTLLADPLRRGMRLVRAHLGPFLRYLVPVIVGLVGIAVLTNFDLVIVRARFPGDPAGEYAAASAFARVALFIPATLLAVLFPRTAARQARGEETEDILGRSLIATGAFCGLLALLYAAAGRGLVGSSFGAQFADGGDLLAPFALAMALYSLANILLGFHLSRGERRFAWIVAAFVPMQVTALALVPNDLEGVVWTNVVFAALLLSVHEVAVSRSWSAIRAGATQLRAELGIRRRHVREAALVVAGATAFVAVLFWPLVSRLTTASIGDEGTDSSGGIAVFWQMQREGGYHVFGTTRHVLTGAPIGWLEANGLHLQSLLPYYPGYLLSKVVGAVGAFNLVVLAGYTLSGIVMYAAARFLGAGRLVAGWAALVYIVFPWHLERAQHGALVHLEALALLVLALAATVRRPAPSRYGLVAAAVVAAWLTFGYFGVMATVAAVAFAAGAALALPSRLRIRTSVAIAATAIGATIAVGILTLAPGVDRGASLDREVDGLSVYGLRPAELVVPAANNILVGKHLEAYHASHLHGSNVTEATNYLGLLTIALAIGWTVLALRRREVLSDASRATTVGLVAVVVVALLFALPSPLGVFGHLWTWTPSRILWEVLSAFRAPSRWSVMAMTALIPLAALCLQAIVDGTSQRMSTRRGAKIVSAAVVAAAALVSFLELAIPPARPTFRTEPVPPAYLAVGRTPTGILAEYPLKASTISLFWQREHGRSILNGAPANTAANDVARTLVDPAAPGTAEKLSALGVTAILTRAGALDFKSESTPDVVNASWGPGYALMGRFEDGSSVWRVTAEPAPLVPTLSRRDFGEPLDPDAGFVGYPLAGSSGRILLSSQRPQTVRLSFDAVPTVSDPLNIVVTGRSGSISTRAAGRTRVSAVVRVPQGRSAVTVLVEPKPGPGIVPIDIGSPWAERASEQPAIIAVPR